MSQREQSISKLERLAGAVFAPEIRSLLMASKAPIGRGISPTDYDVNITGILGFEHMRVVQDLAGRSMLRIFSNDSQLEIGPIIEHGFIGPRIAIHDLHDEEGIEPTFGDLAEMEAHILATRETSNLDRKGPLAVLHAILRDPIAHQNSRHIRRLCANGWLLDFQNGNVTLDGLAALSSAGFDVTDDDRLTCSVLRHSATSFWGGTHLTGWQKLRRGMVVDLICSPSGTAVNVEIDGMKAGDIRNPAAFDICRAIAAGHQITARVDAVWERAGNLVLRASQRAVYPDPE